MHCVKDVNLQKSANVMFLLKIVIEFDPLEQLS